MEINISKILNSKSAIFHNEGLEIYAQIYPHLNKGESVVLSFEGLKNCATQFLNACIGKLYLTFSKDEVESHLTYKDEDSVPMLPVKLLDVKTNALNYEQYSKIVKEAIS